MNNAEFSKRRSKIYTYFYGKNTVFQQFLLVVGVLLLMLSGVAAEANLEGYMNKRTKLNEKYQEAREEYSECYAEYRGLFEIEFEEYVEASRGDDNYKEKKEYNDTLKDYKKAEEKMEKHSEKDPTESFMGGLVTVLGWASIAVGGLWFIYRRLAFNKDGEREVDEELQKKILEARQKGMEKLNIIAEQIERVEPVVLSGVARTEEVIFQPKNGLSGFFGSVLHFILKFDKIIVGLIAAGILSFVSGLICKNMLVFVLVFLLLMAGVAACGYLLFKKFELESYVSPRVINRLTNLPPHLVSKLGSDNGVRVSLPAITVYMFGYDQLYMYCQYVDLVTGKIFFEGVHEYFYEDIVGVLSSQETKKIFKRCGFLNLSLQSIDYLRETISVVSSGCTHNESYIVGVGHSLLDTQFIGMRNLIRQKKAEK